MRLVICGDVHGKFESMYAQAQDLDADVILQVGDTGLFPDPAKADAAAKKHGMPLDYLPYLRGEKKIPIQTCFIKGNHEDFDFLEGKQEIVPGLIYLPERTVYEINGVRFGMLGGNYSPAYFGHARLQGARRRHFTKKDIDAIIREGFDVLLSHDGPKSTALRNGSEKISELIDQASPKRNYHGHHHHAYELQIGQTTVIGLAKIDGFGRSMVLYE